MTRLELKYPKGSEELAGLMRDIGRAHAMRAELNACAAGDYERVREVFSRLTERQIDPDFKLVPPFYTDNGRNIEIGRNVFINHSCTVMDLDTVSIGDDVMIGPNVNIIAGGHPIPAEERYNGFTAAPIRIERNVWICAGATILHGLTVGEGSVVAAGAVVTKNVPRDTVVGGIPAETLRNSANAR